MSEASPENVDELTTARGLPRPRRRHFSKDLWLVLAFMAAAFGAVVWLFNRAWHQHELVVQIRAAGGRVAHDWEWSNGQRRSRAISPVVDRPPGRILRRPRIPHQGRLRRPFGFEEGRQRDVRRRAPRRSPQHRPQCDGRAGCRLAPSRVPQGPGGAQSVGHCPARLRALCTCGISDNCGSSTSPGRSLTDAGLTHLRELPGLERLDLSQTRITDSGLEVLGQFPRLESLTLDDTGVTDAGLTALSRLETLRWLSLGGTRTTEAGRAALKKQVPRLKIVAAGRSPG